MATYAVTINGASKTIQPGWRITESANGQNRMSCRVLSKTGAYRPANDDVFVLTENGTRIFAGLIDDPQEAGLFTGSTAIDVAINIADFNVYASRIAIDTDTSRPSETLKARLTWIAGLLTAQGVSLDGAQATGPTLAAASYNAGRYLVDVLNETTTLATGTGTTGWVWNIDYNLKLSAVQAGSASAPFNVVDGDKHAVGDITVQQPRPADYANYIILLGGNGTRDVADTFTGDGVTATFTLNYALVTSYGYVTTLPNLYETLGTGATWSYDPATNSITRNAGAPALGASIVMTYIAQFPKRVIADGGASAAARVTKIYTAPDVFDVAVMQALANSYVTRDMASPRTVKYNAALSLIGIHPGQTQTITCSKRNLSGTCLVTDVEIVNIGGNYVQRQVTAVTSELLPSTLREKWQQTFPSGNGGGIGAPSTSSTGSVAAPGGNIKDVQFNDGNAFGGNDNFTYDKTTHCLVMGTLSSITAVNPDSCIAMGYDAHIADP